MNNNIKEFFASYTIKLFIWFWLITIISIVSTRFISQQLSHEAFNNVISKPATDHDLRFLHSIEHRIKRNKITSIKALKHFSAKRFKKKPMNIWLKTTDDDAIVKNLFPLPSRHKQAINSFISNQAFSEPKTHLFFHTRITGPKMININGTEYQLFISNEHRERSLGQFFHLLPVWGRIAIPVSISLVLCLLLARSFSKPIRSIKDATAQVGKGDLTTRVVTKKTSSDELGQLAHSFNQMAEQLQQNQSAQQRLLGDVSHELRSPMTRLQMALGLAQQQATSEQAREQYLQRCQVEIGRLDTMVANVLSLSRLENTLQKVECEKLSFNSLLEGIVNDEQFIANEKHINIQLDCQAEVYINGDSTLLTSAIGNVLNNAVKYSPEHSIVEVVMVKESQRLLLTVQDSGQGVPAEALSQLFSPFYRVNLARDRQTGGTGLGLAIAKQAVLAHQGKIYAENSTGPAQGVDEKNTDSVTGLSVTIELPCL